MTKAYIITEGPTDTAYLKTFFPDTAGKSESITFLTSFGYSSALSMAQSVPVKTDKPALLILDADTNNPIRVEEKRDFVEQYVHTTNPDQVKVLLAVPSLEIIFFANKSALELALNKTISDDVWELAKFSPAQALTLLTGKQKNQFIDLLSNELLRQQIAQTPLIQQIKQFVAASA
jgi:hypothetical protein